MFCQTARKKIRTFLNDVSKEVFKNADMALQITSAIKKFISSPAANIITAIIPGDWDNIAVAQLNLALDYAIPALLVTAECDSPNLTAEERLQCIVKKIREFPEKQQEAFLIKLASLITKHIDLGNYKQYVYDVIVQMQYSLSKY